MDWLTKEVQRLTCVCSVCFFPSRTRRPLTGDLLPTFIPTHQPDLVQDILRKPRHDLLHTVQQSPSILWLNSVTHASVYLVGTGPDDLDDHNRLCIRDRALPQREDPV
jgi:hypothetical protein